MFTILSVVFIILMIGAVFYGYGIIVKKPPTDEELQTEACSLCRKRFEKSALIERAVGDSRLYYFCHDCIQKLHEEAQRPRSPA